MSTAPLCGAHILLCSWYNKSHLNGLVIWIILHIVVISTFPSWVWLYSYIGYNNYFNNDNIII